MLDGGFAENQALLDCIKAGRFRLCVTLMAKFKDDALIRKVDDQKRNLCHHLAKSTLFCFRFSHFSLSTPITQTNNKQGLKAEMSL